MIRGAAKKLWTPALAGATQVFGFLQVVLLLRGGVAGTVTDSYFFLTSWSLAPIQVVVLGVVYPIWLRGWPIPSRTVRAWLVCAPIASTLALLAAIAILDALNEGRVVPSVHAWLFVLICVLSSVAWTLAAKLSSEGEASLFASVTLVGNALSCVVLLGIGAAGGAERVTAILASQVVGYCATISLALIRNHGLLPRTLAHIQGSRDRIGGSGILWFFGQASTSYASGLALQTHAASLPAASLSTLAILTRLLGGLNSVVTNATLPRLINAETTSFDRAFKFLGTVISVATLGVAVSVTVWRQERVGLGAVLAVLISWFLLACVNATFKRIAIRSVTPKSTTVVTIVVGVAAPVALVPLTLTGHLSLSWMVLAFLLLEVVPSVWLGCLLRRPLMVACILAHFTSAAVICSTVSMEQVLSWL